MKKNNTIKISILTFLGLFLIGMLFCVPFGLAIVKSGTDPENDVMKMCPTEDYTGVIRSGTVSTHDDIDIVSYDIDNASVTLTVAGNPDTGIDHPGIQLAIAWGNKLDFLTYIMTNGTSGVTFPFYEIIAEHYGAGRGVFLIKHMEDYEEDKYWDGTGFTATDQLSAASVGTITSTGINATIPAAVMTILDELTEIVGIGRDMVPDTDLCSYMDLATIKTSVTDGGFIPGFDLFVVVGIVGFLSVILITIKSRKR
ncbi:MAG: hypothetical protein JW891_04250 [Candidatus Lokiarchaeota archaeon]|nr:hypothetical protein [Candidatus Lokiarchaeota archaeon]